jgi:hypothetical protein
VVPDVEVPADPWAVDGVEIILGLLRLHDEIVPHVLDGNFHAGFLAERNSFANFRDGAVPAFLERGSVARDPGHEQDRSRAVALGIANRLLQRGLSLGAYFLVGRRKGFAPMPASTDARGLQPGLFESAHDFVLVHVAVRLDAFEAGGLEGLALSSTEPLMPIVPHMMAFLSWRFGAASAASSGAPKAVVASRVVVL